MVVRTNKALLVLTIVGLLAGALAMPAEARRKPKKETRVERLEYRTPAASVSTVPWAGLCYWYTQTGCVALDTEPTERWVTIEITDAVSERVAGELSQWTELGGQHLYSEYFCGSTDRPVRMHPLATRITVWIYAAPTCVEGSDQAYATAGTVTFTLSNRR